MRARARICTWIAADDGKSGGVARKGRDPLAEKLISLTVPEVQ